MGALTPGPQQDEAPPQPTTAISVSGTWSYGLLPSPCGLLVALHGYILSVQADPELLASWLHLSCPPDPSLPQL